MKTTLRISILALILAMMPSPAPLAATGNRQQAGTLKLTEIAAATVETRFELLGQIGGAASAVVAQGNYAYAAIGPRLVILDLSVPNNPAMIGQTEVLPDLAADVVVAGQYAYLAVGGAGLRIVDITEPRTPRVVGALDTPGSAQGVVIVGTLAYVADGYAGLRIVDVSVPAAPRGMGAYDTPGNAVGIFVAGNRAYVADNAALRIVDVTAPAAPRELGFISSPWTYGNVQGVSVAGSIAYVAAGGAGLLTVDVANPAAPRQLGAYNTTAYSTSGVFVRGDYIYVVDWSNGLWIMDIANPTVSRVVAATESRGQANRVFVTGNYAYVADGLMGVRVIDVSRPAAPHEVGAYLTPSDVKAVAVASSYAYAADGGGALRVVDVSNLAAPRQVGSYDAPGTYDILTNRYYPAADAVDIAGAHAYLADGSSGLRIINVTNPAVPREAGAYDNADTEDEETWERASDVMIAGRYAYVADWWNGLRIIDVANPVAPTQVGIYQLLRGPQAVFVAGNHAYVAAGEAGLRIVDVSDPAAPREIGAYDTPGSALDVYVAGRYAYVADYTGHLRVIDVANPAAPREVASFTGRDWAGTIVVAGGYAYVASSGAGPVQIVDVTNPAAPRAAGSLALPGGIRDLQVIPARDNPADAVIYVAGARGGLSIVRRTSVVSEAISTTGGRLAVPADGVSYDFAAGTFPSATKVTHLRPYASDMPSAPDLVRVGPIFQATAVNAMSGATVTPSRPFSVTVGYAAFGSSPARESTLALYAWDGLRWIPEPTSSVDVGSRTVTATPAHLSRWAIMGSAGHQLYLPLVGKNMRLAQGDLTITGLEITQGSQDPQNSVPLAAGRPTVLRVYGQTTASAPANDVYITVEATRGGQPLPGSPLTRGPQAVFPSSDRGRLSHSFNVMLPEGWLAGDVWLTVTINPNGAVPESNRLNNTASARANFTSVPPLRLVLVPVNVTDTATGKFYPAPTTDTVSEWLMRSYPIPSLAVTFHAPITFRGAFPWAFGDILGVITSLKYSEGAPESHVYYGLVPRANQTGDVLPTFYTAGMGWLGRRVAIGLDGMGDTLIHEVGHTFGLPHAPCGDPDQVDPLYPYLNASIGQHGFDPLRWRVWSPVGPDHARDVMSYCQPSWFSDYNYRKLYDDQRARGAATVAASAPSLFIRAELDAQGSAAIQPVYAISAASLDADEPTEYFIELSDATGSRLSTHPATLFYAGEDGLVQRTLYASVPLPDRQVARVRLLRGDIPIAVRTLTAAALNAAAAAQVQGAGAELVVSWIAADVPALVRYTSDGGASWTTVGVDVTGGELRLDAASLPGGVGRFEITLADGSIVAPLVAPLAQALPDAAPAAWIHGAGRTTAGEPLVLLGHGDDREDGPLADTAWTLNGAPVAGGATLQLDGLEPGSYLVTLTVRDRAGQVSVAEKRVVVGTAVSADGGQPAAGE